MIEFARVCGLVLDEWQEWLLELMFLVDDQGHWAATEVGFLVARQNGKGEVLVAYSLAHLFLFPRADNRRKTIMYTAHEVKTATDGFQRIVAVIESVPALSRRVKRVYTANGQERIELHKRPGQLMGDRLVLVARSKKSGRGFSGDVIIQDEAQEESQQARAALTYTQSAVPNRQEVFAGTVPEDGVNDGEVFEGVRDRGRSTEVNRTAWAEWTPPGSQDPEYLEKLQPATLNEPEIWAFTNPAAPRRITWETIAEQYARDTTPRKATFARERLSIWPNRADVKEAADPGRLNVETWTASTVEDRLQRGAVTLAVAMGRGGGYASISGAQRYGDGDRILVEHLRTDPGTLWIVDALRTYRTELGARLIVMDEKNCGPIIPDLQRKKIPFMAMGMSEVAAAYDMFVEYVNASLVVHPEQEEVDIALEYAEPRVMSKAQNLRTWDQADPAEPVTPIQTATLAVWALKKFESRQLTRPGDPQALADASGSGRSPSPYSSGLGLGADLSAVQF